VKSAESRRWSGCGRGSARREGFAAAWTSRKTQLPQLALKNLIEQKYKGIQSLVLRARTNVPFDDQIVEKTSDIVGIGLLGRATLAKKDVP
jgi:hypothetical protein